MKLRSIPSGALLVGLAAGCGGLGGGSPEQAASSPEPVPSHVQTSTEAANSLECPGEQEILASDIFVGEVPGAEGPATPQEAINAYFAVDGIGLTAAETQVVARNPSAEQRIIEREGDRMLSLVVQRVGDSWVVSGVVACTPWLSNRVESGK